MEAQEREQMAALGYTQQDSGTPDPDRPGNAAYQQMIAMQAALRERRN